MKILFYTGKGGVGKSTMAAAAAWQLSRRHRVLIVSLDPAHNLGDIFCVTLKNGAKQLAENLHLREVDLKKLSRDYLEREVTVLTDTYKYLQVLNLDRYFSILKYSPGIEEYALLTSIEETIRKEKGFDYIIFDTPPTGAHTAVSRSAPGDDYLDRPADADSEADPGEAVHDPEDPGASKRGAEKSLRYVWNSTKTRTGSSRDSKTMKNNYDTLNGILQGEDCGVVLVFNPDVLSLRESDRLIDGLNELGLPLRLLINNKVSEENREMASRVEKEFKKMAGENSPCKESLFRKPFYCGTEQKLYDIPEDLLSNLQWKEKKDV